MSTFLLLSVLITLAAFCAYVNFRWIKLPSGIALMLMGAVIALGLIVIGNFSPAFTEYISSRLAALNFSEFILGILLSFLLFADRSVLIMKTPV